MHRFNPAVLKQQLDELPHVARVAFALACTARLAACAEPPIGPDLVARKLAHQFVYGAPADSTELADLAKQLQDSPELDRDDVAASFYTLDCLRRNDAQAALWAAQRANDAWDLAAQDNLAVEAFTSEVEEALLNHPFVQSELAAQLQDITDLIADPQSAPQVATRALGGQRF